MTDTPPAPQGKVAAALAKAFAQVEGAIEKDGSNSQYSFTSESAVAHHVRPALAKHGLVICPAGMTIKKEKDGQYHHVELTAQYRIYHSSGEYITLASVGENRDRQDKAVASAQTMAFKTLLIELFCLARGADPDARSPKDERAYGKVQAACRAAQAEGWRSVDFDALLAKYKVKAFSDLDPTTYDAIITILRGEPTEVGP